MLINKHSEGEPLSLECCLCKGQTSTLSSASAFIIANGQECRVYYHKVCFATMPESKQTITKLLNEMAQNA